MVTPNTLFDRLGGIRKMAEIVGEAPSTVQSWKNAERIPAQKQPIVIERAAAAGLTITADEVVFPMRSPVAICGVCERSASDPVCDACTRTDCGLRQKEAA